jgi:ferredoxin
MKANVDKATCIGCGLCPKVCPDVFNMYTDDDDRKAKVIAQEIPKTSVDSADEAKDNCPVDAISIQ